MPALRRRNASSATLRSDSMELIDDAARHAAGKDVLENGVCSLAGPGIKLLADPQLREAYLPKV